MQLTFVEATVFTRRIRDQGLEEDLRELQQDLLRNPDRGALDPGTGGLRKVRMRLRSTGKGKSSGARVHYLYLPDDKLVYLIYLYSKAEQAALTPEQKKELRLVVEAFKRER